jgi:hypothetical protein
MLFTAAGAARLVQLTFQVICNSMIIFFKFVDVGTLMNRTKLAATAAVNNMQYLSYTSIRVISERRETLIEENE